MSITLTGVGNKASSTPLAVGVYYKDGISTSPPYEGQGWTAGLPGTASNLEVTVLRVQASATRTAYSADATYNGSLTDVGHYWDGAAWQSITIPLLVPWSAHGAYTSETNAQTFDVATPATIAITRRFTCTSTSGGNVTVTAFTLT